MVTTTPSGTSVTPAPSLPTGPARRPSGRPIGENVAFFPTKYYFVQRVPDHEEFNGATRRCLRSVIYCRGRFEPGEVVAGDHGVTVYAPHSCRLPPNPQGHAVGWQWEDDAGHTGGQVLAEINVRLRPNVDIAQLALDQLDLPRCRCDLDRTSGNRTSPSPTPTTPRPTRRDTRTHP